MGEMKTVKAARYWGVVAVLAVLVAAVPSEARIKYKHLTDPRRDYTQRGFQLYLGFGGQGYEIRDRDYEFLDELDSDGMFFFGAALGVDRGTALYFEVTGSEHDTPLGHKVFGYGHVGVKYAPNTGYRHPWQPYGKASFGAVYLAENDYDDCRCSDEDDGYVGPSIGLGLGIDRFISRRAALFAEVGVIIGRFEQQIIDGEDYDLADDIGLNSGRIQFGLRFRL
jgi:hypothetical protein